MKLWISKKEIRVPYAAFWRGFDHNAPFEGSIFQNWRSMKPIKDWPVGFNKYSWSTYYIQLPWQEPHNKLHWVRHQRFPERRSEQWWGWERVKKRHINFSLCLNLKSVPRKAHIKCYWDSKVRVHGRNSVWDESWRLNSLNSSCSDICWPMLLSCTDRRKPYKSQRTPTCPYVPAELDPLLFPSNALKNLQPLEKLCSNTWHNSLPLTSLW